MFCEKCGAQLPDTASFCNKCGNALRKSANTARTPVKKASNVAINQKKPVSSPKKNSKRAPKNLAGALLVVVLIVIVAVAATEVVKKRTNIYGTWTDANRTVTFTFNKDGTLWVAGANNILGADAFQFTKEKGVLHLNAKGLASIGLDLEYEISGDALHISIGGQNMTLYRAESSDLESFDEESPGLGNFNLGGSDAESSEAGGSNLGDVQEAVQDWAEDTLDTVQIYALYGTWTDSSGTISLTFTKDGKLSVSGWDILSVNAFTFSEVDSDTLQLQAEVDNPIGTVGLKMGYEIEGDSMTVTVLGQELTLMKKE